MIDVTVKTLDSQNHRYSVPDDITVKQFKDRIAASVSIPPDKQRLIYCGRVLQDEKNLSEYNVHEKVIHLVMRAPPQSANRSGDRRTSGPSSNTGGGTHFRHRGTPGSENATNAVGRQVLFGSVVLSEDGIGLEDLTTTTQGPSSSGVRLQQAKTMLDKASEVLNHLEGASNQTASGDSATTSSVQASASSSSKSSNAEPMEASSSGPSGGESTEASSSSQPKERNERQGQQRQNQTSSPAEELEVLYQEMDALNNMDPPMVEGGHLMTSAMGNPLMGALSNSLQGGLFQAASAAFVSALSSMGATPVITATPSTITSSSSTTTAPPTTTTTTSTPTPTPTPTPTSIPPGSASSTSPSSSQSPPTGPSNQSTPSQAREGPPSTGNPLSGVRGITVRITNRGSQRSSGIRLEHPRCSVMVEVLDQYQEIQRRLQPFLQQYYRSMVEDRAYEGDNDRRLHMDQLVLWRVSAALHYLSHALHAISDIIVDLRRNPPRQLRARPFIIPQPALVQAQINVAPSSDGPHHTRVIGRSGGSAPTTTASVNLSSETSTTTTSTTSSSSSSSSSATTSQTNPPRTYVSVSEYLDDDNGVVFMHVGPNGITIDSLSSEGTGNDASPNPPPELIQNIMSSLSSQLGMRLGAPTSVSSSSTSGSTTSSTSPPSTPSVRRATPVHNSQAAGNSGTSTTNATQTRVTPRAQQVHVTPLHVPGMGMTQFDPFLPCQSHHIRPSNTRRRHRATIQTTSAQSNESNSQETEETSTNQSSSAQHRSSSEGTPNASSNSANANHLSLFANLLAEIMSGRNGDHQSEEEQQQERVFAQLVRGVMSEVSGSIGGQGESARGPQQQTSLREFLEPFSGEGFFSEGERDSIFAHLFTTVSQSLSMGDLIQLFFGDSGRLNQLFEPLQRFVREQILKGAEPSENNMDRAIDEIILDIDPHLLASAGNAAVHDGIDYVSTVHNFIRHRLHDIFNLVLNHREQSTFGTVLVSLLRHALGEFVALSLHCFTDGAQGLERFVEGRVQSIMSGMSPLIQAWSVNTSIIQLRSMMSHLTITDDHIRRYIVSPDEGRRMDEARQNRMSPVSPTPGPHPIAESTSQKPQEGSEEQNDSTENSLEVMEIDELGGEEEVTTTTENTEGAIANEEPPMSVTVGSQSWHSAVPQDWIPVITRDVERQRRGVSDTNLSDGYLCGVPLKRRKIATQNKPHGTVQQVLQDTLRQSLRTSGVNRNLIESVAGEVSSELGNSFATHVRYALRDELEDNKDFKPEKFPKSEQKIRKK